MRLFGGEKIASVVDRMGMEENDVLEAPMLNSAVERAQKKVEENNFGVRKRLLEYDDVMNSQREVVYSKRRNALSGERVEIDVMNMMQDIAQILVEKAEGMPYEDFTEYVMSTLSVEPGFDEETYSKAKPAQLIEKLYENMLVTYKRRMDTIIQRSLPILKDIAEKNAATIEDAMIRIPVSDGRKVYPVLLNIKKAVESEGRELIRAISKSIVLFRIDDLWKEHLRDMDDLKQSVQNATYEQKDPLLVYKFESFNLFSQMLEEMNKDVVAFLLRAHIPLREGAAPQAPAPSRKPDMSQMNTSRTDLVTNGGEPKSKMPVHVEKQVGRNDPCPCGSGKKFKNCHGKPQA